jgi:mono/diheme cytochrome c family protein
MRRLILLSALFLTGCSHGAVAPPPGALSAAEGRGAALVQRDCSNCHALAGGLQRPNTAAPDFAVIAQKYNALSLERVLGEIAVNGHWEMPRRPLSTADIRDLAAFIEARPPAP